MPKFKVKSPLSHDGKDYNIGDSIDMSDEAAAPLLGHTLAKPHEDVMEKKPAQDTAATDGEAARLAELRQNLAAEQEALRIAQEQLVQDQVALAAERDLLAAKQQQLRQDQTELAAAQEKLAADRADLEKTAKAKK